MDGDVLLERGARVLVVGQPLLGGGDALARGLEPRLERLLALGLVGQLLRAASAVLSSFCRAMSRSRSAFMSILSQKKGPAEAEPEVYIGCDCASTFAALRLSA